MFWTVNLCKQSVSMCILTPTSTWISASGRHAWKKEPCSLLDAIQLSSITWILQTSIAYFLLHRHGLCRVYWLRSVPSVDVSAWRMLRLVTWQCKAHCQNKCNYFRHNFFLPENILDKDNLVGSKDTKGAGGIFVHTRNIFLFQLEIRIENYCTLASSVFDLLFRHKFRDIKMIAVSLCFTCAESCSEQSVYNFYLLNSILLFYITSWHVKW